MKHEGRFQPTGKRRGHICVPLLSVLLMIGSIGTVADSKADGPKMHGPQKPPRFAVISDPHLYDARLGITGAAFHAYLAEDPKLLAESEAILDAALKTIVKEKVRFVIISGDLTKDGEVVNHVLMARHLAELERHGIQAYVIPGNHDINNPDAARFREDVAKPVPAATPQSFRGFYQRFGYGQAIERDPHSLSYLAEPMPGLWLLAIDSCKYVESKTNEHPVVSGRIGPETMEWIQSVMEKAHHRQKHVIAMMHHGINQHFFGQADWFQDWLVDDWTGVSMQLAQTGLKVIFTGHYHSTDAAYLVDGNGVPLSELRDVETASLAAYPCAFRMVTVDDAWQLHIETRRVMEVEVDTDGVPFQEYALNAIFDPTVEIVIVRVMAAFGLPYPEAAAIAPLITQAIVANYAGDENPSPQTQAIIAALLGTSTEPDHTLGLLLAGLWTDLPPTPDSDLVVPLADD